MKRVFFLILIMIGSCFFSDSSYTKNIEQQNIVSSSLAENLQALKTREYQREVLPHDFSYLINLLHYGKEDQKSSAYPRSIFKLFSNILKGAEFVNPYAFNVFLDKLPKSIDSYFVIKKSCAYLKNPALFDADMLDRFKESVNALLYTKFSSEFDIFKSDPENFLEYITCEIVETVQEEFNIEQLRQSVIRFLEIGLSKLVWSPQDQEKSWENVKSISHKLAQLMEYKIIEDVQDLDDLFWTLVHRFCYSLEVTSTDYDINFYEKVKNDIATEQLLFLELEEQDMQLLEQKVTCLARTVLHAEAKCRAYQRGILMR